MSAVIEQLEAVRTEAATAIAVSSSLAALDELDILYLGRKGRIAQFMNAMKDLAPADRPLLGKAANEAKLVISSLVTARREALAAADDARKLDLDRLDVSLPAHASWLGGLHPVTQALNEIVALFRQLGFGIEEGPDIEDEWHNFDALNIPASHPARDAQDTFFVASASSDTSNRSCSSPNRWILRTHTSPVQIRAMQRMKPPVRFVAPGRVYRNERIDASHFTTFHQVEGLYVDRQVTFAQLKGTLLEFVRLFYGPAVSLRFRPGYFPFTEPSAEVDVTCTVCSGKGCSVCKQTGWVEILGSGMVHPHVFRAAGYDPGEVTGFAFGMGVERIAILKHGIDDIRLFYENDNRFLSQFA